MHRALWVLLCVPMLHAQTAAPGQIRSAATRAVAIVQHGTTGFSKIAQCFSCHDHAMPMLMLHAARERGVVVDEAAASQWLPKRSCSRPTFHPLIMPCRTP